MSSLPVRLRVTLAFTLAMALLLAALGAFLYLQLRSDLDETIDDNLRSRLGEVSALAASSPSLGEGVTAAFADEDETFVQVLDADGAVAFSTPAAGDAPLGSALRGSAERQRPSRSRERRHCPDSTAERGCSSRLPRATTGSRWSWAPPWTIATRPSPPS